MVALRWIIIILVAICAPIFPLVLREEALGDGSAFENIPAEQQLFKQDCPEVAKWPSAAEIKEKHVPDQEVPSEQLVGTHNWIRKFIQSKWLPDDLKERLIPLRALHGRDDYFIVRYQVDDFLVQIKDSDWLHVTVRPLKAGACQENLEPFLAKTIKTFVVPSRRVENLKTWRKTEKIGERVYKGILLPQREHDSKPFSQLHWISDGAAVYFRLEKRGGIDPKPKPKNGIPRGTPLKYLANQNLDTERSKLAILKAEKKKALGYRKFTLLPEDEEIKKKYDKLIEEELRKLGKQPSGDNQEKKQPKEQPEKHEREASPPLETEQQKPKEFEQSPQSKKVDEPETVKTPAPEKSELVEQDDGLLVPVLIVAGVVLAGAVVFLLLRRKK